MISKAVKYLLIFLSVLLITQVLIFCKGCKPGNGGKDSTKAAFYGLAYSKGQVMKWLNTKKYKRLVFQFYSSNIEGCDNNFQLLSYTLEFDSAAKPKRFYTNPKNPDTLSVIKDSVVRFSGPSILGNLDVRTKKLEKFIKDNTVKLDFDYLYFRPMRSTTQVNHQMYEIHVVKDGVALNKDALFLRPDPSPPAPPLEFEEEMGEPGELN